MRYDKGAKVSFQIEGNDLTGKIFHILPAGETPSEFVSSLGQQVKTMEFTGAPNTDNGHDHEESYLVMTKKAGKIPAKLFWLFQEDIRSVNTVVRQYGLMNPINWGSDCDEHLQLQNKLWNRLVEIERDNRQTYLSIVGTDEEVVAIEEKIAGIKTQLAGMDAQRKDLRRQYRSKISVHTKPLDEAIKRDKEMLQALSAHAKEIRSVAKERIRSAGSALEELERKRHELVRDAYNNSGLWWGNYNAVVDSYRVARSRAMREVSELKFHRFDGTGRFTCQIQGGMLTGDLLSGRHNVAQLRLINNTEFAEACNTNPPPLHLQEAGSRRDNREYGILTITIFTAKNEQGEMVRRTLDFPIILHRSLPTEAILKSLSVNRRRVGSRYRWSVRFTFNTQGTHPEHSSPLVCGINLGWKQVQEGVRIATIYGEHGKDRDIVLPKELIDKFEYAYGDLQSRIDTATNKNFAWILDKIQSDDLPMPLLEARASLRRARKPRPGKFAQAVITWRGCMILAALPAGANPETYQQALHAGHVFVGPECAAYMAEAVHKAACGQQEWRQPQTYEEAERRRKMVKRLTDERTNLQDKTQLYRQDIYRCETKKIAEKYGRIALDKMDLRKMAKLEKSDGTPNELHKRARRMRVIAAVSEFREWMVKQAAKSGAIVVTIGIASTHMCSKPGCGGRMEPVDKYHRQCSRCGQLIDQDENAAANLFQLALVSERYQYSNLTM